jgi:hypothetical protein
MKNREQILAFMRRIDTSGPYVPFNHGVHAGLMWALGYNPQLESQLECQTKSASDHERD